jgi:hypothetical protein
LHPVRGVRVNGEGHPDIGVPQHLLSRRGVDAIGGKRGGEGVPQTVEGEPFARKTRSLQERLKVAAVEVTCVHGFADGVGEDEVVWASPGKTDTLK